MNRIAVLTDDNDTLLKECVGELYGIEVLFTDWTSIPPMCECVIASQKFFGIMLPKIIEELKQKNFSVCVATEDGSKENQEKLLSIGADDVIVLPMPAQLITKRLSGLVSSISLSDFTALENVAEANKVAGAYVVDVYDFMNLYKFVLRVLERLDKKALLVKFELKSRFKDIPSEAINDFTNVVQRCLRRGDITCPNGNSLFVILIGSDEDGGKIVSKRLIDTYNGVYDDDAYDIEYETKELNS